MHYSCPHTQTEIDQVILSTCSLSFNKENWRDRQPVSLKAVEDFKMDGKRKVMVHLDIVERPSMAREKRDAESDPFDDLDIDLDDLEVKLACQLCKCV